VENSPHSSPKHSHLARDLEENRKEIKELNEKVYALASSCVACLTKLTLTQRETAERKALVLKLENELLKARGKARSLKSRKKISPGNR
jgi:hypothetical protein